MTTFLLFALSNAQAGLVGEWTLDGDALDSTGANDASTFGSTSYDSGVVGDALSIDAQGGGATMDSPFADIGTGDFTVSLWVNYDNDFTGHARHEHPITSGHTGGGNIDLNIMAERSGSQMYWWVNGTGTQVVASGAPWVNNPGTWTHIAMGRDGSNQYLCIDGALYSQGAISSSFDHSADPGTFIGRESVHNGGRSFPGLVDEVQVYDEWIGEAGCADLYANPGSEYGAVVDSDGDGFFDDEDSCPDSDFSLSSAIDDTGCSIDDFCPCEDPGWSNHGDYLSCVASVSNDFKADGLISGKDKGSIQKAAAQSDCGK